METMEDGFVVTCDLPGYYLFFLLIDTMMEEGDTIFCINRALVTWLLVKLNYEWCKQIPLLVLVQRKDTKDFCKLG